MQSERQNLNIFLPIEIKLLIFSFPKMWRSNNRNSFLKKTCSNSSHMTLNGSLNEVFFRHLGTKNKWRQIDAVQLLQDHEDSVRSGYKGVGLLNLVSFHQFVNNMFILDINYLSNRFKS